MRRRFLPFFPFPKPLPLLDIHDPRYFSLVSTHKYASPTEKFPCPARLDDGRGAWSGPCARVSGSWRGFRGQAHDAARKYLFDGREGSSNPLALQRNLAEPQGVGDDGDGTEAHRGAGEHGAQQPAENGIENARSNGNPHQVVNKREREYLFDIANRLAAQLSRPHDSPQITLQRRDPRVFNRHIRPRAH